jgi:hypothetical protein
LIAAVLAADGPADSREGLKGVSAMANKRLDRAERRRVEFDHDHGTQPLFPVITAASSAEAVRADLPEMQPERFGPANPRFAYLTRSYG